MDIIKLKCLGGDVFFSKQDVPDDTFLMHLYPGMMEALN